MFVHLYITITQYMDSFLFTATGLSPVYVIINYLRHVVLGYVCVLVVSTETCPCCLFQNARETQINVNLCLFRSGTSFLTVNREIKI